MRQHLLFAMMMCAAMNISAQTDMTSRIVNPSFESNLDGWTNEGMQAQSNSTFTLKVGSKYAEKWTSKGSKVGNASLKQTVSNLPNGNYTLSVKAQNIQQDSPEAAQSGVYVQLNSAKTQVKVAGTYEVTANVTNGTINISFVLSGATGNYVCVDDFRLMLNSCTLEQLNALIATSQELVIKKMADNVKVELEAAIAAAQAQTGEEGITDVAAALSNSIVAAKASAATFAALDAAIAEATALADEKMNATVRDNLNTALAAAQALTTADNITKPAATLDKRLAEAKTSVESYAALKKALDNANEYHATAPANGADELKAAIDEQQAAYDAATMNDAACAAATKALESALILCHVANATGKAPTVTSEHYMPVGSTAMLGRMTASGSNIIERGYVWATHPNPTVGDERSTLKYSQNGDIYELSPMTPATCYYVRAYAMTKTYAVAYGEEQRLYTLPKASCTWSYDEAGDAATNDRIRNATIESVDLYNKWTSIPGFHLNVHYVPGAGAGDGTADCSYGGWMRVSQNVSYQRTGTLLHESNHGVGVGTSDRWKNWDGSNMRADGGERGQWMGWRATQMVRFFDHNETSILNGDGTHMWPYGINGAHEDDNRKITYIANTLVTHAVHQDGLAAVGGIGASPAYTFEHQDDAKYYITNSDADHGAGTAFLYETSTGALKWGDANDATLKADDTYAWQFEYVPAKAYYRIRNVASGRYFNYSGSTIKTVKKTKPGSTENFQLMIAYNEVTVGEDKTVTKHPYYIQAGTGDFAPYTLNAGNKGAANGATLNLNRNTSATQRWLILTEDEAMTVSSARIEAYSARLQEVIDAAKAMLAVPHTDNKEGATTALQEAVEKAEAELASATSIKAVKTLVSTLTANIRDYVDGAYPDDMHQPYNLTCLIEDRDFTSTDYWNTNTQAVATVVDGVAQVEGAKFKYTQTLADMPKGVYTVRAQAYQTVEEPTSYIYIYATAYKGMAQYIGTDEQTAAQNYAEGQYDVYATVKRGSRGNLLIGITNPKTVEGDKTVFGNFRLYGYGNDVSREEVDEMLSTGIDGVAATLSATDAVYDLSGRRVTTPHRGIYIKNGKKVVVK